VRVVREQRCLDVTVRVVREQRCLDVTVRVVWKVNSKESNDAWT
jgi:hypothetical protein